MLCGGSIRDSSLPPCAESPLWNPAIPHYAFTLPLPIVEVSGLTDGRSSIRVGRISMKEGFHVVRDYCDLPGRERHFPHIGARRVSLDTV